VPEYQGGFLLDGGSKPFQATFEPLSCPAPFHPPLAMIKSSREQDGRLARDLASFPSLHRADRKADWPLLQSITSRGSVCC